MQRIIQINIAGRLLPIEEDAYLILKDYIATLQRQFDAEPGRDEIIQDIEYRIAELFSIRLQNGAPTIDRTDVSKVIETLGPASDIGAQSSTAPYTGASRLPASYTGGQKQTGFNPDQRANGQRRIYRNPNDKMLGGVCSGIGNYFDIDPVIVRLIWVAFAFAGIGVIAYIISWVVIPVPKTPADFAYMSDGTPMNFHDMTRNLGAEMQDLKKRGEDMSRELREFFSRKSR